MPEFTYAGPDDHFYPFLPEGARRPVAGEDYVLAADPGDGRWVAKNATVSELREQAEALGVEVKGLKKAELLAAIEAAISAPAAVAEPVAEPTDDDPVPTETPEGDDNAQES